MWLKCAVFRLPNIIGAVKEPIIIHSYGQGTGALTYTKIAYNQVSSGSNSSQTQLDFDASQSNSVYNDKGSGLPLSISKNSYIVYK